MCFLAVIIYIVIWCILSVVMIRIKQNDEGFDLLDFVDSPNCVFWLMSLWPVVAPPWFAWRLVKKITNVD